MDEKKQVRIQDDLYQFVNRNWIEKAEIPGDRSSIGSFGILDLELEKLLMNEFKEMAEGKKEIPNENMKKAITIYKAGLDTARRDKDGVTPLLKHLHLLDDVKTLNDFMERVSELDEDGFALPFNYGVEVDMQDSLKHAFAITGPSIILPDTTYYAEGNEKAAKLLGVWKEMALKILSYGDLSKEDQLAYVEGALAYDKEIAKHVKSQLEWADYVKSYNPMSLDEVDGQMVNFDLKKFLTSIYKDKVPQTIIVSDPRALKEFGNYWNEEIFDNFKKWAYVRRMIGGCGRLTEELREIANMYRQAITGNPKIASTEKHAFGVAEGSFSEVVGIYYGEKYFGEEAKKDVVEMVKKIIETYKSRIKASTFLKEETKEKAILKLSTMKIKMGYPDKWDKFYDTLEVDPEASYYEMLHKIANQGGHHNLEQLYKPVDHNEWAMPGHLVNACYDPTSNDITFPAAILQKPFYSLSQKPEENLGGIGAVIGHEISHAFDNDGAQCDENGNLNNWWTEDDYNHFQELTKDMIAEFDGIEINGGKVNGELVVSENIADNGGMAVTLEIMSHMENADYQAYFKNWARVWCIKARPEYLNLLLSTDVHSPAVLRANMQPRNFPEWYKAFDVKETDEMYIAPEKRIIIW